MSATKTSNKRKRLTAKHLAERLKASKLWHRRFAHASAPCIFKNSKVTIGMTPVLSENREDCCAVCALAKFVRKKFAEVRERATRVGQIIHTDVIGPMKPKTRHSGKKYVLIVIDDYSRYMQTFVMKTRDETPEMMDEALRKIQSKFPGPGQFDKVRCDKGGEFKSREFTNVLKKYGATPEYAETDVHQHNGTSE
jgi:hypothetical protein